MDGWDKGDGEVAAAIREESQGALSAYREQPKLIEEHASQERETKSGGYGRRQSLRAHSERGRPAARGRREDPGHPDRGRALLREWGQALQSRGGGQHPPRIPFGEGRCADRTIRTWFQVGSRCQRRADGPESVGFLPVLRSGCELDRKVKPTAETVPLLRIAEPFDPEEVFSADPVARDLAEWAATIVRLPLDR